MSTEADALWLDELAKIDAEELAERMDADCGKTLEHELAEGDYGW